MVYVLDKDNNPLMPTNRYGRVRHLLKDKKAKVVKRNPYTIKLLHKTTNHKQKVTLGVDSGSKVVGLSATTKKKGWLAPSIQHKIDTHLTVISKICEILPIDKIIVETASFDMQKLKDDKVKGCDYQQGNQLGFWNVREYVCATCCNLKRIA